MSLPIVFRRAAQCEFDEAAEWYETRRPGCGAKFTGAVRELFDRIAEQPDFYATVLEDVREALVSTFPYCVYYRIDGERILVCTFRQNLSSRHQFHQAFA